MKRIVLRDKRDRSLARRHPWVFSGAIASGEAKAGELVEVASASGETLGFGWYSPASQIRVRMVAFGSTPPGDAWLDEAIRAAVARRADLLNGDYTNAMRLVNAENDFLPGVVADRYDGFVVCQLTSAGADANRQAIAEALMKCVPGCRGVAVRNDVDVRAKEGLSTEPAFEVLAGEELPAAIAIFEGECKFLVDVRNGHKTGYYLDQREARKLVGSLANGCTALNCFCYTGGFGLFLRAGGAKSIAQVDISGDALALARRNEELMFGGGATMEYVEEDVFRYLRQCRDANRKFDLIVLDPPKFASVKSQVMKAARGYKDINLLAMKLLSENGILATFSCSGAMDTELFDKILAEAAADAKRDFQVIARTRAGRDHPVSLAFPDGAYLKGVILRAL